MYNLNSRVTVVAKGPLKKTTEGTTTSLSLDVLYSPHAFHSHGVFEDYKQHFSASTIPALRYS